MVATLILVDGHALVHRAFHAVRPLTTSRGELVNAVFGFAQMLLKALHDLQPTHGAVAFDLPAPTFRHQEYAEYKANRIRVDDGLHEQFDRVRELISALGIPAYQQPGFEADDVLGTLALQARQMGIDVVIVTGDADALQLVEPGVRVMAPLRGFSETITYDTEAVVEKYGFLPGLIPDYKALAGDASDNIKGVPGIGDKTASRLLAEKGSLEAIIAKPDMLPARLQPVLVEHAEQAIQSKHLATIVRDVPNVHLDLEACRLDHMDRPKVVSLFRDLEFRVLMNRIPSVTTPVASQLSLFAAPGETQTLEYATADTLDNPIPVEASSDRQYSVIATAELLQEFCTRATVQGELVIDLETTSIIASQADLVGISLSLKPGEAFYVPVGHRDDSPQLPIEDVRRVLGPVLANFGVRKVGHNLKYDVLVLERFGMDVVGVGFDTMIAAYLSEPAQRALNLKDLAFTKLGVEMTHITDLIGKGRNQITMAEVPVAKAAEYACADSDMTLRLKLYYEPILDQAGLRSLFRDIEMPLVPVLADMERIGIALDTAFLAEMSVELGEQLASIESEIYANAGHQFNIGSTRQLASVLFEELHLPSARKTKTGYSTDADTLEVLRSAHPIVGLILEHRQLQKLKSTYVDALPTLVSPLDGRLHTSLNQTIAATGRISSSDPNLQNIPVRTEVGRKVRRAFIAGSTDTILLSADYSQIELRILAHVTDDPYLLGAFGAEEDIHTATAALLFGVPIDKVTSDQRRLAKTTNFGIIYGISDFGLSQQLGISRREASEFITAYFARYPTVRGYLEGTIRQTREHGFITTLLGRRRFIPEIDSRNAAVRGAAERAAINTPIQGTAADIIKIAMIRIADEMAARDLKSRMLLQVHDELLFECTHAELDEVCGIAKSTMEGAMELKAPLKVDMKAGGNWRDMAPVG